MSLSGRGPRRVQGRGRGRGLGFDGGRGRGGQENGHGFDAGRGRGQETDGGWGRGEFRGRGPRNRWNAARTRENGSPIPRATAPPVGLGVDLGGAGRGPPQPYIEVPTAPPPPVWPTVGNNGAPIVRGATGTRPVPQTPVHRMPEDFPEESSRSSGLRTRRSPINDIRTEAPPAAPVFGPGTAAAPVFVPGASAAPVFVPAAQDTTNPAQPHNAPPATSAATTIPPVASLPSRPRTTGYQGRYNTAYNWESDPLPNEPTFVPSGRNRDGFRMGDVFSMPYHVANMDPTLNMNGGEGMRRLRRTIEGYVYTKRRMFVVLYKHQTVMICMPIGTHRGRGMLAIHPGRQYEYACLHDLQPEVGRPFVNMGSNPPIEFNKWSYSSGPLDPRTLVDLTRIVATHWDLDMRFVGRVTQAGHWRLFKLHNQLEIGGIFEGTTWDPRDGPEGSPF